MAFRGLRNGSITIKGYKPEFRYLSFTFIERSCLSLKLVNYWGRHLTSTSSLQTYTHTHTRHTADTEYKDLNYFSYIWKKSLIGAGPRACIACYPAMIEWKVYFTLIQKHLSSDHTPLRPLHFPALNHFKTLPIGTEWVVFIVKYSIISSIASVSHRPIVTPSFFKG